MTGHNSTQLGLQVLTSTKTGLATKTSFSAISLLIRRLTRPMGAGSWPRFHAAFCTQCFVICFLGESWGIQSEHCIALCSEQYPKYTSWIVKRISKIYISLKLVFFSDIFWHVWGKLSKHMGRNIISKRWLIQRTQNIMEQRWFQFAFNSKSFKSGKFCAVICFFPWHQESNGQGPGKAGRSVWGVVMQGSMASK